MFFCIKIAGIVVGINHRYDCVRFMCHDYITDESPVFTVSVDDEDIEREHNLADFDSPSDMSESTAIYRKIADKMIDYDGFLFHSAVIEYGGGAYAFSARSGVGKSTHISLWQKHFGDKVTVINGDKPIFRIIDNMVYAFGTPWCGKEMMQTNTSAPLKALCFIERGEQNEIVTISSIEMLKRLYVQILMPNEKSKAEKMLELIDKLVQNVPCYLLKCNISDDAVMTAYNAIVNDN